MVDKAIADRRPGATIYVSYSAYESKTIRETPVNNLNDVAIEGKAVLVCGSYKSDVVENPTWLDLSVLMNDMIIETGDHHHVFLEGVNPTKRLYDGVPVYEFSTGS